MEIRQQFFRMVLPFILLVGCTPTQNATSQGNPYYTQAAQTIAVTLTSISVANTIEASSSQTAAVLATQMAPTAIPTESLLPTLTATPEVTLTPGISMSPTSLATVTLSATTNTNCRTGPAGYYKYQSALMVGQTVRVLGRTPTNSWWLIEDPEEPTKSCWVWNDTTVVSGDPQLVQTIIFVSTPEPEYTISGYLSTDDYSGSCPVTITAYGKIKANTGSYDDLSYGWTTSFGVDLGGGTTEFHKAGSQTFSSSFTISSDTDGYVRFKLYEPALQSTGKMYLHVDCE